MINLLRADFYKLTKSKAFYICTLLAILFAMATPLLVEFSRRAISSMPTEILAQEQMQQMMNLDNGLHVGVSSGSILNQEEIQGAWMLGELFAGNLLPIFLLIFTSIFIVGEYSNGAIKNTVSKGFGRTKIYVSKCITVSAACLIMLISYIAVGTITTTVLFGFGETSKQIVWQIIRLVGTQCIIHIALTLCFVAIAMAVKHNGAAIAINIGVMTLGGTILQVISLLFQNKIELSSYWIANSITTITSLEVGGVQIVKTIGISLVYLVVSTMLGMYFFQRQDIK